MKSRPVAVKQVARWALAGLFLATLAGCSSNAARVETWQGSPAAATNAATLETPGAIKVSQVNGRNMTNFLMDDLALDYALLPGENEVVFINKTIWAKSGVVENGESKVHVIKSDPQVVRFTVEPGTVYRFRYDQPKTRSEAESMREDFSATVITDDGKVVAESSVWEGRPAADRTPVLSNDGNAGAVSGGGALDTLKAVWATASEEEKKAFLRWAFE
ncbi:DUF2057 domain-containing protein [Marinobacter salinus]|uniref:DUF2057 domain-containing protein n=1 Tax=Marinobacter salinus TaxID=1874317 RepID=A0A1D9GRW9_9GAMM|nr:DUF2057 domain-containing protein [Marinobacter salinus]